MVWDMPFSLLSSCVKRDDSLLSVPQVNKKSKMF